MPEDQPLLRVVRGNPSPEEVAALVAVLSARGSGGPAAAVAAPSRWSRPQLREPLFPGPGAWVASAGPG